MNCVVIGTSWISEQWIQALNASEHMRFYGVFSRQLTKATALVEKYQGSVAYDSMDTLLNDPVVDIVYIASPNSLHFQQAKQVLLANKTAIVEKPIVSNRKEMAELLEIANQSSGYLFEAIMPIHMPRHQVVKELIPNVGKLKLVAVQFNQYSSKYNAYRNHETTNVFDPKFSGGALYDLGIYAIYVLLAHFGKPKDIRYMANIGYSGVDVSGVITMRYDNFISTILLGKDNRGINTTQIIGEDGNIVIEGSVSIYQNVRFVSPDKNEVIDVVQEANPMIHEIRSIEQVLLAQDKDTMNQWLSLASDVCDVMEEARCDAGIVFEADRV